jgi:endonuclease/exonuclease/phosphatase family metal-dependent hydrolase
MASKFRLFTKRFFIYSNVTVVLFFLLACLAPYLNPQKWWFISFLGLAFPFLLVIVLSFFVTWLLVKPKFALISLIAMILGLQSTMVFFAFNNTGAFQYKKDARSLRIVSWNVARFIEMKRNNNPGSQSRLKMMELIKEQDADILCFQEFFHSFDSTYYPNIDHIRQNFNYPYSGSIIFSRYPIIDSGMIRYPRPTLPDALMHADIKIGVDTIRVYTTHLQSLQFGKEDYERINKITEAEEGMVSHSKTIMSKLKWGIKHRSIQADLINQVLGDSPYPVIFCGDLNDVPNSYTYFTVKGEMQDAFLKKGFGIGRTFSGLSPTLRIDYIFADEHFKVRQFNRVAKRYSDHYMLVSDMALKKQL